MEHECIGLVSVSIANKSLHRTHLFVTPFAEQKPCQPTYAAELNRYGLYENN